MIVVLLVGAIASYWLLGLAPWSRRLFAGQDRRPRGLFLGTIAALHACWAFVFLCAFPEVRGHLLSQGARLGLAALLMLAAGVALAWVQPRPSSAPSSWVASVLLPRSAAERFWHVPLSLLAGFSEELVYRLAAIPALVALGLPGAAAVAGSSLAFVLIHGRAARGMFAAYLFFKGVLYGAIFMWSHSLLWPFVIHTLSDLAVLLRPLPSRPRAHSG